MLQEDIITILKENTPDEIRKKLQSFNLNILDDVVKTINIEGKYPTTKISMIPFLIKYRDVILNKSSLPSLKKYTDDYNQDIICLENPELCREYGMVETPPDGNCFFHCISHLVNLTFEHQIRESSYYRVIILKMLKQMIDNEFIDSNFLTNYNNPDEYLRNMLEDGEWAGELEIIAAANLYHQVIVIKSQRKGVNDLYYFPKVRDRLPGLWILYHVNTQHNTNTIGNHYNYNKEQIKKGSIFSVEELEDIVKDVSFSDTTVDYSTSADALTLITEDDSPLLGDPIDIENFLKQEQNQDIELDEVGSGLHLFSQPESTKPDPTFQDGIQKLISKLSQNSN